MIKGVFDALCYYKKMDYLYIFGRQIPVYGLMGLIGVSAGFFYIAFACKYRKKSIDDSIYIYVWACIFAMLGAKILYLIIESKNIVTLIADNSDKIKDIVIAYLTGGFVFYGGLFGAIIGTVIASKYFGKDIKEQLNILIPVMPLVHGFGRIGCYIVGCCYGMEYDGICAVNYVSSSYAPNGVELFPVQLAEAVIDFVIFGVLLVFLFLHKLEDKYIYIYLVSYSVARFVLEFFRGDTYRGKLLYFSTSQWISICIVMVVVAILLKDKYKRI